MKQPNVLRRTMLGVGAVAALAAWAPFAPGITFTIKSSTTRDGATSAAGAGTRVQALNGVLRFDGESKEQSAGGKESYVIFDPAARSMKMVMPSSRQYIEINLADSTAQALGATASLIAATTVVSDIQVSGTALGSGGTVNGYSTNRYRITTSYAEVAGGAEGQRKVRLVEEFWVTSQLKDIPDPMEAFTRAFSGGKNGVPQVGGTMSELMRKRGDAQRRLFTGLPLKTVATTTLTERDGTKHEETSVTEIVDLQRADLDAATFRVPDGYARMDMKAFLNVGNQLRNALSAGRKPAGGSADSAGGSVGDEIANAAKDEAKKAVDETKQESKDAAKEAARSQAQEAKEKAKCALGGMFGRKC